MINDYVKEHFFLLYRFSAIFAILLAIFAISILGQFSANSGVLTTGVANHIIRIAFGTSLMLCVYFLDFKIWNSFAYIFYAIAFCLLIMVSIFGTTRMGAQRWINLYFFSLQPSEIMKIALVLALARYYSLLSFLEISGNLRVHIVPFLLTLIPSVMILKQPDLGTAVLLFGCGIGMIFISGFPIKLFLKFIGAGIALCPIAWFFIRDYQKNRLLTFFNPESDPHGIGYHVLQSKIAIGSGKIFGKGFLQGTQSRLYFLPEKNTDFIFTTIAEEVGFVGCIVIIFLFLALIYNFFSIAKDSKTTFSRMICSGLGIMLFLHVIINISMVMGLVPVVGIPLPFLSYGGSSMLTFLISCGLIIASASYKAKMSNRF